MRDDIKDMNRKLNKLLDHLAIKNSDEAEKA